MYRLSPGLSNVLDGSPQAFDGHKLSKNQITQVAFNQRKSGPYSRTQIGVPHILQISPLKLLFTRKGSGVLLQGRIPESLIEGGVITGA